MKGLISCRVACRFYDIPTGKCRLKCAEKADPNADFYDDCPLPDAAEVKHGRWVNGMSGNYKICTECKQIADFAFDYCPCCGAKMDGGENDGN